MKFYTKKLRYASLLLLLAVLFSLAGCAAPDTRESVVCSSPVISEWTRAVLGEDAKNINIITLGARGSDVHSYQPTVRDIAQVARCSVFIRNGGVSETWADGVIESAANDSMQHLALCEAMENKLCSFGEQDHTENGDGHAHDAHAHEYDEHIWLSFELSCESLTLISDTLSKARPAMADAYAANAAEYIERIREIERGYSALREQCGDKLAVLCDRDPFYYLWDYLGLECAAAYEGCSAESEASFSVVSRLSGRIDERGIKYVLVCESSDGRIADAVISAAKEKNIKVLTLDSMQSELGADGYISALKSNLAVLTQALAQNGD